MLLKIILNGNDVELVLEEDGNIIEKISWQASHQLSSEILSSIDALLKKHNISPFKIESVDAQVSETAGVTAARVVRTIAQAWSAGVKM